MKTIILKTAILLSAVTPVFAQQNKQPPHLDKKSKPVQWIVNGKPFLVMGGELGNSTASYSDTMRSVWPQVQSLGLNTLLVPVYWEEMEPRENVFDFALINDHIMQARKQNMKIVFLWFGTWKNSMSCYAPGWMKTNASRFERATGKNHQPVEIFSVFGEATLKADQKAFAALMQHIKTIDAAAQTVIMIQVENEIGMLGPAREITATANAAFNNPVPAELMNYLIKNKETLTPELRSKWESQGYKTSGNWETVFGAGLSTDELFQAWFYAKYANAVAEAGKAVYNIPMYVNAALNRKGVLPGDYPSAGPLPQVMEIWQCAAPAIDMLSPDFYNPDTEYWCNLFTRKGSPLFIPEMRFEPACGAKALFVFGHYNTLGFSPFSIESGTVANAPLHHAYDIIRQLQPYIVQGSTAHDNASGNREGVLLDKTNPVQKFQLGGYNITCSHDALLPWSAAHNDSTWNMSGGIIMQLNNDEFIVGGTGMFVTFHATDTTQVTNILSVDEGRFINNSWQPGRRLNGDEDHQGRHLRIPYEHWSLQRIKLYNTKIQ